MAEEMGTGTLQSLARYCLRRLYLPVVYLEATEQTLPGPRVNSTALCEERSSPGSGRAPNPVRRTAQPSSASRSGEGSRQGGDVKHGAWALPDTPCSHTEVPDDLGWRGWGTQLSLRHEVHTYWGAAKTQVRTVRPFLLSFPLPLNVSSEVEHEGPGLGPQILCPPQAAQLAIAATNVSLPLLSTDCHSLLGSALPFHRWGSRLRAAGTWPRSRAGSGRLGLPASMLSAPLHRTPRQVLHWSTSLRMPPGLLH